jgi:hypothetical protein
MDIEKLPQPLDTSSVSNTAAAIAAWCLKALVPRVNELIENQQAIIKELRDEQPVRDGTPGSGDFSGGDGAATDPDDLFATNGQATAPAGEDAAQEAIEGREGPTSDDMQELAQLLQDLDSRAAQNLGDAGLSNPDALREATDEELQDVSHVGEVALKQIRAVYPHESDE